MDVVYARCAGLDVHKETLVACVHVILGGKTTREVKTFETTTSGLLMLLAWLMEQGCTHVAMEATGVYWKPVWHILSDGGFELVLANAAHIKNVPGRKTDVCDASWIADLLAYGLIRASFVPEQESNNCVRCYALASSCAGNRPAISKGCRRRLKTPTSNLLRPH